MGLSGRNMAALGALNPCSGCWMVVSPSVWQPTPGEGLPINKQIDMICNENCMFKKTVVQGACLTAQKLLLLDLHHINNNLLPACNTNKPCALNQSLPHEWLNRLPLAKQEPTIQFSNTWCSKSVEINTNKVFHAYMWAEGKRPCQTVPRYLSAKIFTCNSMLLSPGRRPRHVWNSLRCVLLLHSLYSAAAAKKVISQC